MGLYRYILGVEKMIFHEKLTMAKIAMDKAEITFLQNMDKANANIYKSNLDYYVKQYKKVIANQ
jgi:hypothetical protein